MKKTIFWLTVLVNLCAFAALAQEKAAQEQREAIKKYSEKTTAMNVLIQQARDAMTAKNWQGAIGPLQQLIELDSTRWEFYSSLGDAQLSLGKYDQAVGTYEKGIKAAAASDAADAKLPNTDPAKKKAGIARMLANAGNCYVKLQKNDAAILTFTLAAEMDPNPAMAYFNLCATLYNTGETDEAIPACEKAIVADPKKADAYFIKGSLLIAGSTTDRNGKVQAPAGTIEALKKYLELAPDGGHVSDVKAMLDYLGVKVETGNGNQKKMMDRYSVRL